MDIISILGLEAADRSEPPFTRHEVAWYAGMAAGLVQSLFYAFLRSLHLSTWNPELVWGSLVTGNFHAGTWFVGLALHLAASALLAAMLTELPRLRLLQTTLLVWIIHGTLAAAVEFVHPQMPGRLASPGPFLFDYGTITALACLGTSFLYAVILTSLVRIRGTLLTRFILQRRQQNEAAEHKVAA